MTPPFRNPSLPLDERVADLLARLTLEEKLAQLGMDAPAVPALGLPAYHWWNEALHGVARNGIATVFPQAIALAATWDPALHERIAEAISTEARAKYHDWVKSTGGASGIYQGLTIWSPNINIYRDPRWGRGQETYGECPFLTGRFAVAFCHGLQGDDPRHVRTVATVKHFAVHSGPEAERHGFDARPTARDLWETYLPAFETAVQEGGARSVMTVYNAIHGVPGPVNTFLLEEVLRRRWGFGGAVVGDVDCIHDVHAHHHYTRDAAESSALALRAGNDLCSGLTYAHLPEALRRGLCTETDVDRALTRLLHLRFRLGLFDPDEHVPYARIPATANDSPAHDALAREAAARSMVLLKNDGVLPLRPATLRQVAVIGPVADEMSALLGNYCGTPSRPTTLLAGIRQRLNALDISVAHEPGCILAAGFPANQQAFGPGQLGSRADGTPAGFLVEIWNNRELRDQPATTRTDPQVDLFWDYYQPLPGVGVRDTSARWSGYLVPPVAGEYCLDLTVVGGVRLWLGEVLLLDEWAGGPFRIRTLRANLAAGQPVALRLELTQTEFTAKAKLGWRVPHPQPDLERALALAATADLVILTLGLTPDLEGEENPFRCEDFVCGDRRTLRLPAPQRELLERLAALGRPLVLVLTGGGAISFEPALVNAAIMAWYHGQRGGEAVADLLLGTVNPSGRLPVTFYRSEDDLPPFGDYGMEGRTYRYFAGEPLYAFGHGLSYSRFAFENLAFDATTREALVDVVNLGPLAGEEVVQFYVRDDRPGRPRLQLCGFGRVHLQPGERQTTRVRLDPRPLRRWDEATNQHVLDPVPRILLAGPASDRLPLALPIDL